MISKHERASTIRVGKSDKSKTHLKIWGIIEVFACKQFGELVAGFDPVTLVLVLRAKRRRQVHKVPFLDVVVTRLPPVDISFNGVSFIADHKATPRVSKCHG